MIHYAWAMHKIIEGAHFDPVGQYFNTVTPLLLSDSRTILTRILGFYFKGGQAE